MGTTAKAGGGDFPKAPVGTHVARCYQVVDIGDQKSTFQGVEKYKPKVLLSWELLGDDRMEDGKPYSISSRYTLSLSDKGQLGPMLESWRGKPFTKDERDGFDIKNVLGHYCMISVIHNTEGDKTYANVASVMALPKGMPKPTAVNPNLYFNLDTDDFETLPEWLLNTVKKSRQFSGVSENVAATVSTGKRTFEQEMEDTGPIF